MKKHFFAVFFLAISVLVAGCSNQLDELSQETKDTQKPQTTSVAQETQKFQEAQKTQEALSANKGNSNNNLFSEGDADKAFDIIKYILDHPAQIGMCYSDYVATLNQSPLYLVPTRSTESASVRQIDGGYTNEEYYQYSSSFGTSFSKTTRSDQISSISQNGIIINMDSTIDSFIDYQKPEWGSVLLVNHYISIYVDIVEYDKAARIYELAKQYFPDGVESKEKTAWYWYLPNSEASDAYVVMRRSPVGDGSAFYSLSFCKPLWNIE